MNRPTFFALFAIALSPLIAANSAKSACPTLPYTFTNGQTADAGDVVGDLNAIQLCIANNGSVNTGTAGQLATYSATGNAVSGASLSSFLDASIGSTQGSVLYRNAAGWVALGPGSAGQLLSSGGAGANPSWVGGLVNPFYPYASLATPNASAFTLVQATGITSTLANMASGRGTVMNVTGGGSNSMASMEQAVLSQTSFTVTTNVYLASSLAGNWFVGIGVRDNTGKYDSFGWRNSTSSTGTFNEFTFSNINTVNTTTSLYGLFNPNGPVWLRLQLTGGNFVFSASFDGETWDTVQTVSATHYLGSTLSTVGLIVDNNSSRHFIVDTLSWQQSTP